MLKNIQLKFNQNDGFKQVDERIGDISKSLDSESLVYINASSYVNSYLMCYYKDIFVKCMAVFVYDKSDNANVVVMSNSDKFKVGSFF